MSGASVLQQVLLGDAEGWSLLQYDEVPCPTTVKQTVERLVPSGL